MRISKITVRQREALLAAHDNQGKLVGGTHLTTRESLIEKDLIAWFHPTGGYWLTHEGRLVVDQLLDLS